MAATPIHEREPTDFVLEPTYAEEHQRDDEHTKSALMLEPSPISASSRLSPSPFVGSPVPTTVAELASSGGVGIVLDDIFAARLAAQCGRDPSGHNSYEAVGNTADAETAQRDSRSAGGGRTAALQKQGGGGRRGSSDSEGAASTASESIDGGADADTEDATTRRCTLIKTKPVSPARKPRRMPGRSRSDSSHSNHSCTSTSSTRSGRRRDAKAGTGLLRRALAVASLGMANEVAPELTDDVSLGGSYFLNHFDGHTLGVFKPEDEEPYAVNNPKQRTSATGGPGIKHGVRAGEGATREIIAYLLDKRHFAGVPPTALVVARHDRFFVAGDGKTPESASGPFSPTSAPLKSGSFQLYVPHVCSAEDISTSLFPAHEVHKIALLDLRLFNMDRNTDNLLVRAVWPEDDEQVRARALGLKEYWSAFLDSVDTDSSASPAVAEIDQLLSSGTSSLSCSGGSGSDNEDGAKRGDGQARRSRSATMGSPKPPRPKRSAARQPVAQRSNHGAKPLAINARAKARRPPVSSQISPPPNLLSTSAGHGDLESLPGAFVFPSHPPRTKADGFGSAVPVRASKRVSAAARLEVVDSEESVAETDGDSTTSGSKSRDSGHRGTRTAPPRQGAGEEQLPAGPPRRSRSASANGGSLLGLPMRLSDNQVSKRGGRLSPPPGATMIAPTAAPTGAAVLASASVPRVPPLPRSRSGDSHRSVSFSCASDWSHSSSTDGTSSGSFDFTTPPRDVSSLGSPGSRLLSPLMATSARGSSSTGFTPKALRRATNIELVPIDHGLCLPHIGALDEAEFAWLYWKQAKLPLDSRCREYVESLDADEDIALLRRFVGSRLRPECALTLRVCTQLLKQAVAAGLTVHQIGMLMVRHRLDRLSDLERAVAAARASVDESHPSAEDTEEATWRAADAYHRRFMEALPPFLDEIIRDLLAESGAPVPGRAPASTATAVSKPSDDPGTSADGGAGAGGSAAVLGRGGVLGPEALRSASPRTAARLRSETWG